MMLMVLGRAKRRNGCPTPLTGTALAVLRGTASAHSCNRCFTLYAADREARHCRWSEAHFTQMFRRPSCRVLQHGIDHFRRVAAAVRDPDVDMPRGMAVLSLHLSDTEVLRLRDSLALGRLETFGEWANAVAGAPPGFMIGQLLDGKGDLGCIASAPRPLEADALAARLPRVRKHPEGPTEEGHCVLGHCLGGYGCVAERELRSEDGLGVFKAHRLAGGDDAPGGSYHRVPMGLRLEARAAAGCHESSME